MDKIIAICKPKGLTANEVLKIIKSLTGKKKVGHAGTLDPLATGVLVVGIGRSATKKLSEIVKKEKEYIATIRLGWQSTTDDEEGEKRKVMVNKRPTLKEVEAAVFGFWGKIMQIPPRYSAIKVKGKEAYKLAREGKIFDLESRGVEIKELVILDYSWPSLKLRVTTGPGVYIRSLARDIGEKLKVGGYLADLERTRVGDFTKKNSISLSQVHEFLKS